MRSRLPIISLFLLIAGSYQSCDSSLNVDKPKDFYKYIGMDGDQTGVDLVADPDGNAYVLGSSITGDKYGQQLYVVMTNPRGEVVWSKTYGDLGDEVPKDIEMLTDGTLVVLADRPDGDYVIYHLDKASGAELKPAVVSGLEAIYNLTPGSSDDHANSITQTLDGFIVAGYTNTGTYKTGLMARYYADMTAYPISWNYRLIQLNGSSGSPEGYDVDVIKVVQQDVNTFFIFGYTNTVINGKSTGDYNYFVQTSSADNTTNEMLIIDADPVAHSNERLTSVTQAPVASGGGYVLTGYTSNGNSQDIFVARVVQGLGTASQDTFLGRTRTVTSNLSNLSSSALSLYPSATSGFYVLGAQGVLGDNNLYLTKLGNDLGDAWSDPARTLGGVGDDASGAVAETADGRILVVGTMVLGDLKGQRKLVLMNLNSDGYFGN